VSLFFPGEGVSFRYAGSPVTVLAGAVAEVDLALEEHRNENQR
jgi:hypothetical protein